jgi:hypothetical protein
LSSKKFDGFISLFLRAEFQGKLKLRADVALSWVGIWISKELLLMAIGLQFPGGKESDILPQLDLTPPCY